MPIWFVVFYQPKTFGSVLVNRAMLALGANQRLQPRRATPVKIINICGARPNFMKIAPLMRAYRAHAHLQPLLVHTGQHYDRNMSDLFFAQLEIPEPDVNLGVGSGSPAHQTAQIMQHFEPLMLEHQPDIVLM